MNTINGKILSDMMVSGANNLYNHKSEVDDLNVFPVPDGDTGTNMSLTARAMASELLSNEYEDISKATDKMAFATLRGARGNSGVILSQIFRGISKSLKGKSECTPQELAGALSDGAAAAYKAVMKPTEGTILTVARVAAEGAVAASSEEATLLDIFKAAAESGKKALDSTPDLLPALKQAGVVDAGGRGWLYIIEGALYYLENNEILETDEKIPVTTKKSTAPAQAVLDGQDIKFHYCTEFIIRRFNSESDVDEFRSTISPKGDCMLVIDDDEIIKVHIHTNHPGFVLENAVKLGELVDVKIDNMKIQHNSILENNAGEAKKEVKLEKFGFVAVSAGKGLTTILTDLGVTKIIEGGQTMNPSTNDFLKTISKINAENIFIFPNNKNIIMAAAQAKELSDKNIIVIPTTTIPQCISAMMAFNANKDAEGNEKLFNRAMRGVKTAQITFAVRDTEYDGYQIKKGDILGMIEGKITATGSSPERVAEKLIRKMVDDDSEFITVYRGKTAKKQLSEELVSDISSEYEDCEVKLLKGGQPLYYYYISVE